MFRLIFLEMICDCNYVFLLFVRGEIDVVIVRNEIVFGIMILILLFGYCVGV